MCFQLGLTVPPSLLAISAKPADEPPAIGRRRFCLVLRTTSSPVSVLTLPPARLPTSAFFIHSFSVCAVRRNLAEAETIFAHRRMLIFVIQQANRCCQRQPRRS